MRYRYAAFDIDGTLIDTERMALATLRETVLELTGRDCTTEELRFAFGIPGAETMRRLGIDVAAGGGLWLKKLGENFGSVKVFDGIREVLETLRGEGCRIGIITSKLETEYNRDFLPFGLGDYFPITVCADECRRCKPFPEPALRFLEKTGASTDEVLYIGDTGYDADCAHGAGMAFGLALWGAHERVPSEYYFAAPSEIADAVRGK